MPPPTAGELLGRRGSSSTAHREQYLRSHGALRAILGTLTDARLDFAVTNTGSRICQIRRNCGSTCRIRGEMAMVGAALDVEIGVDVEQVRPLSDYRDMAERFFPPSEAAGVGMKRDFFRRWTRIEATIKATGAGLYGMGMELNGEWTIEEFDAGPEYSAAVALPRAEMTIVAHEFGEAE